MSDQPPDTPRADALPTDGGPIYCRSCGAEIEPDAQFCGRCGTPTRAGGADPTMVTPAVAAEPLRRTTVVDEPDRLVDEPVPAVRPADNWWSGPFIFMAAAILVVLIVVLAVALSRGDPTTTTTTIVPVTVPTTAPTTVAPVIVPPPVVVTPAPTAPPQTAPPQTAPPETTTTTSTTTTTAPPA